MSESLSALLLQGEGLGFDDFDYVVFLVNILIFVFSRRIVGAFRTDIDPSAIKTRLITLRILNLVLFLLYFVAVFITEGARKVSKTGLTLLLAFLVIHALNSFILHRYGRVRTIEDKEYRSETYQSEVFSLLALLLVIAAAFLSIVNIWEITGWLQTTSVIGGLLVIIFSTREAWAPDNINGLILLYNGDVKSGCVVRVAELDLLAIALRTTLTQITFKDLVQRNKVIIPNSRFRGAKIEILSDATASGLWQSIDFNLGYGLASIEVEEFFKDVWDAACEAERGISPEAPPRVRLAENGDHAACWRLFYLVGNIYRLMPARYAINRAAYDLAQERGIGLNTPLTHTVLENPNQSDSTLTTGGRAAERE